MMLRSTITGKPQHNYISARVSARQCWLVEAGSAVRATNLVGGLLFFLMCIQAFSSGIPEEMQFVCECLFKNSEVRSLNFES